MNWNWKLLTLPLLGLSLTACDNKKEEKKADAQTPPETMKVEEPKMDAPKMDEPKMDEPKMGEPKEEPKAS